MTIKEQFVYRNERCIENCEQANQKIKKWLFWYNTQRYPRGLNYQTPLHYSLGVLNDKTPNML
jgi:transposase InsO family protein